MLADNLWVSVDVEQPNGKLINEGGTPFQTGKKVKNCRWEWERNSVTGDVTAGH